MFYQNTKHTECVRYVVKILLVLNTAFYLFKALNTYTHIEMCHNPGSQLVRWWELHSQQLHSVSNTTAPFNLRLSTNCDSSAWREEEEGISPRSWNSDETKVKVTPGSQKHTFWFHTMLSGTLQKVLNPYLTLELVRFVWITNRKCAYSSWEYCFCKLVCSHGEISKSDKITGQRIFQRNWNPPPHPHPPNAACIHIQPPHSRLMILPFTCYINIKTAPIF